MDGVGGDHRACRRDRQDAGAGPSGVASKKVTYTNNWPSEPLVGNTPPPALWLWSAFSVLFLIAGIAALGWHHAVSHGRGEEPHAIPASDPFALLRITPSMRATAKYFWVVLALFLVQILLGAITAHYQVEGQQAYGFALSEYLPYSLSRTWHTQLAVLWIATAWLGTGLYIAPAMSGHEPKFQRFGVNFLFVCLLLIVVGAFAGQWFAVMQKLGLQVQLLVRPPGLGIRRHGPLLAVVPVHRPAAVADAGRPRAVADPARAGVATPSRSSAAVPVHRRRSACSSARR